MEPTRPTLTVGQLIGILFGLPKDAEVWIATSCHGCFVPADVVREDKRGMVVIEESD